MKSLSVMYYPKMTHIAEIKPNISLERPLYRWHDFFVILNRRGSFKPGVVITIEPEIIPLVPALDNPSEGKKETSDKAFGIDYRRLIFSKPFQKLYADNSSEGKRELLRRSSLVRI